MKDYSLMKCLISLLKINIFHEMSPVLNREILASISYYLSHMRYMNLLMWDLKLEAPYLIYQKYLIRAVMMVLPTK